MGQVNLFHVYIIIVIPCPDVQSQQSEGNNLQTLPWLFKQNIAQKVDETKKQEMLFHMELFYFVDLNM